MTSNFMNAANEQTVMVFVINKKNELLLFRRLHTWFGNNEFAPPGGLVDINEKPEMAAIRECREETGIEIKNVKLLEETQTMDNNRVFHNYYYSAEANSEIIVDKEPERHSELNWYPIKNLPPDTMPLVRNIIEKYLV